MDVVLMYDGGGRAPLKSLGDGIQRLFEMAVAAASEPSELLLIDEFENGLHWSLQETLWRNLRELATRENIQIVATTHSWDCISAFASAMSDDPELGQLVHLGKGVRKSQRGQIIATTYDTRELTDATRARLEVR